MLLTEHIPQYPFHQPYNEPDVFQDLTEAINNILNELYSDEINGLQQELTPPPTPLENGSMELIPEIEKQHSQNLCLDHREKKNIEKEDKKQCPEQCKCRCEEPQESKEGMSLSVTVPCCGKSHQINLSQSHKENKQHPSQTHQSPERESQEGANEMAVSTLVNCCNGQHLINVAVDWGSQRCQGTQNKEPVSCEQDGSAPKQSQEKERLTVTLTVPYNGEPNLKVKTFLWSSYEPAATQKSICDASAQDIYSPKQEPEKESKSLQQCEQEVSMPEAYFNVESMERKNKLNKLKKMLYHKSKMSSHVAPRYVPDKEGSQPHEICTKDCVLGQRKSKDPNSWKKKLQRICHVYVPDDLEEPAFQYIPEVLPTSATIKGGVPPLQESLMLLTEGLEAGSLVAQFEQLYRRKPGLTVTEARRQENEKKNRYRDISPYDTTRVILTSTPSGDYINASYVNMEVQGSGIINRYIASQGPLAGTCTDFWHMVWEQQSTLIVMLTTVVEQGRVKCHRYWPRLYETVDFGILQVTCNKEEETPGFAFREFTLINTETQEERHITHMQYLAWPDHGVPDDSTEFLNFVTQVRKARVGMVEPTIVHCSAGIGRTGVLILMETAQCLIEANEPIYPLDIVKAMRDQRAMMIQTASQFRFVCEAIHRVYTEELVKPLAEYQQR